MGSDLLRSDPVLSKVLGNLENLKNLEKPHCFALF